MPTGDEPQQLDPGDAVDVSLSTLYRPDAGGEMWIKVGVQVHVRQDEDPQQTYDRGFMFCVEQTNESIIDFERDGGDQ